MLPAKSGKCKDRSRFSLAGLDFGCLHLYPPFEGLATAMI